MAASHGATTAAVPSASRGWGARHRESAVPLAAESELHVDLTDGSLDRLVRVAGLRRLYRETAFEDAAIGEFQRTCVLLQATAELARCRRGVPGLWERLAAIADRVSTSSTTTSAFAKYLRLTENDAPLEPAERDRLEAAFEACDLRWIEILGLAEQVQAVRRRFFDRAEP